MNQITMHCVYDYDCGECVIIYLVSEVKWSRWFVIIILYSRIMSEILTHDFNFESTLFDFRFYHSTSYEAKCD